MSRVLRFTSRTKIHKHAVNIVFEVDQRGMGRDSEVPRDPSHQRRVIAAAETLPPEYSIQIIKGVTNNLQRTDDLIAARMKVSELDRITAVDLVVMRVAVWEMLENSEDVSAIIVVDEAISIVKSLSTDAAPSFVNTVLDAIRKGLEAPAWTCRGTSVVEDGPALDSESGPALDPENEGEEPTEEHDDAEDASLPPELMEPGKEGPTDELSDEESAESDELLDEY